VLPQYLAAIERWISPTAAVPNEGALLAAYPSTNHDNSEVHPGKDDSKLFCKQRD
jgi:hypothetical protein